MGQININDGETGTKSNAMTFQFGNREYEYSTMLTFADTSGASMFQANKSYSFRADNLFNLYGYAFEVDLDNVIFASKVLTLETVKLVYSDGTQGANIVSDFTYNFNPSTDTYSLYGNFKPDKDVYKIVFYLSDYFHPYRDYGITSSTRMNLSAYFGTYYEADNRPLQLDITVQSEEAGLLGGILGWIQNIFDSITELPAKLWGMIENGLKSLFVPSEEYMSGYSDKWDELLASRFGAVYQVCDIVIDSWDNIMSADERNIIDIPVVTIPLGDSSFTFGGYDVQIVPAGFETLVEAVKLIAGIVCTYLFINGLLKRYDELMGVET